ncbi:hypothetical protein, partial [Chryseobacterium sp. SIMBA_028]
FYYVLIVTLFSKLLGYLERHLDVSRRTPAQSADADGLLAASATPVPARRQASAEYALQVKGAMQRYGRHEVLKNINLDVRPGQVVSI